MLKYRKTLHGGNSLTCATDCKYRTAATICRRNGGFFFRYVIVGTLHKVDKKDNNNNNNNLKNNFLIDIAVPNTHNLVTEMKQLCYFSI